MKVGSIAKSGMFVFGSEMDASNCSLAMNVYLEADQFKNFLPHLTPTLKAIISF